MLLADLQYFRSLQFIVSSSSLILLYCFVIIINNNNNPNQFTSPHVYVTEPAKTGHICR